MSRLQITLIVALVGLSWAAALAMDGQAVDRSFFAPFSWAVTAFSGVYLAFNYVGWRLPPFTKLMPRPDLRGTWSGVLRSNWVDPNTGLPQPPREAFVVVYETFQLVHVRLMTEESESVSLAAVLVPEADDRHQLLTMYRNDPTLSVREHSPVHLGGAALKIVGEPPTQLSGHYWTDRGTAGELEFTFVGRERAGSFQAAKAIPPKRAAA
jgi:hypothetical protein